MQSHTLRRMYFSQYQDSPATLGSLTRLPHEKAMCIIGASLTKPHINVLNANGVCMYVCMYTCMCVFVHRTVNTFLLNNDTGFVKNLKIHVYFSGASQLQTFLNIRGSCYGTIVLLKGIFWVCWHGTIVLSKWPAKEPANNGGERET